nr:alcohol dehydrogenase catalytic domain-containing protein [Luteibacter sp. Sphag1AF]
MAPRSSVATDSVAARTCARSSVERTHACGNDETQPDRLPGPGEVRIEVAACGVCRTDLHVVDGELPHPQVPITPGHEIVGRIDAIGSGVNGLAVGQRVGVTWLGHTCGVCHYCVEGRQNLCDHPLFTGYTRDGGFATSAIADADYVFPLGEVGLCLD